MRHGTLKIGVAAATVLAGVLPLALIAQPAYADYAPNSGDVVGVGSDTLQYMIDFLADGNGYGYTGYNQLGNKYKLVNIDATADANARLAYGVDGGNPLMDTTGVCTPGTGSTPGTANQTTTNTGVPCVLNPTVVLRAGLQPVLRPNGSGAGFTALEQDIIAGDNAPVTGTYPFSYPEVINFSRSSSNQVVSTGLTGLPSGEDIDQISLATDTLPMIISNGTGSNASHAVPLSATQLSYIYAANTGSCITWSNPQISGVWVTTATVTAGSTSVTYTSSLPTSSNVGWVAQSWTGSATGSAVNGDIPTGDTVASVGTNSLTLTTVAATSGTVNLGLVNPAASTDPIIPLIPQVGTGTRTTFLKDLNPALSSSGTCAEISEQNDPTAIYDVSNGLGLDPRDAIEPMSQGRLDLYLGVSNTGTPVNTHIGDYFLDPSCAYLSGVGTCGSGSVSGGTWATNAVAPAVKSVTTGTPVGIGGALFDPSRSLYIEVRSSDVLSGPATSSTAWQPGKTTSWVQELFYDPCTAADAAASDCTTATQSGLTSGTWGPAGAPYIQSPEGILLVEQAGVTPIATETCTDLVTNTSC